MKNSTLRKLAWFINARRLAMLTAVLLVMLLLPSLLAPAASFSVTVQANQQKAGAPQKGLEQSSNWFAANIAKIQQTFNREMVVKIREFKKGQDVSVFLVLVSTALLYGFLHGIGPGHGKTVIAGWVLSQKRTLAELTAVSAAGSFIHAFTSVIIVFVSYQLLGKFVPGATNMINYWLQVAAAVLLITIGLQVIVAYIISKRQKLSQLQSGDGPEEGVQDFTASTKFWWIALSVGIVPCPLAAIIFVFCLTNQLLWPGVFLVAAFAIGMGLSIFSVAASVWMVKSGLLKVQFAQPHRNFFELLNVAGGVFFIAFGLLTLLPMVG